MHFCLWNLLASLQWIGIPTCAESPQYGSLAQRMYAHIARSGKALANPAPVILHAYRMSFDYDILTQEEGPQACDRIQAWVAESLGYPVQSSGRRQCERAQPDENHRRTAARLSQWCWPRWTDRPFCSILSYSTGPLPRFLDCMFASQLQV